MKDIASIVQQMTLAEKAALVTGASAWTTTPVARLGVPELFVADGPHGVRRVEDVSALGAQSIPATCFPTAALLAATWDADLIYAMGQALAKRIQRDWRRRAARAGRQYEAHAAVRAQFRVLLRRPVSWPASWQPA
jgi:beta-glucosidase-like glycosyl hydrolase